MGSHETRSNGRFPKGELVGGRTITTGPVVGGGMSRGSGRQEGFKNCSSVGRRDVGKACDLFVHSNIIQPDEFIGVQTLGHKNIHEENIVLTLRFDQGHGATEGELGGMKIAPSILDPTRGSKVVPGIVVELPEGSA
jgi:hypothetical protein